MDYGIVYLLTNPVMPGLVKIGMTTQEDIDKRMRELYTTGVPVPFEWSPTEKISIFRNGTNDVAFSSPFINLTTLYGYGVIQAELYDFLGKCFFYVTFRKNPDGELQARYIYLNSYNWNADYDY